MIENRPKHLLAQEDYKRLPTKPFAVDFESLPKLVRQALGPLGGNQPMTGEMAKAAHGQLRDMPSNGEIELFKEKGSVFQMISLVLNIAHLKEGDGTPVAIPYSLSLMPASKRGAVDERNIDLVSKLDAQKTLKEFEPCYAGFDPFSGDFGLYGPLHLFIGKKPFGCFLDELGIVIGQFFLANSYDPADVLEVAIGFPSERAEEKYRRHRAKLLYTPFTEIKPRRVGGRSRQSSYSFFRNCSGVTRRRCCKCLFSITDRFIRHSTTSGATSTFDMSPAEFPSQTCTSRIRSSQCSVTLGVFIAAKKLKLKTLPLMRSLRRLEFLQCAFPENLSWKT